jgi:ribonuclease P/MRP protein subunit POP5
VNGERIAFDSLATSGTIRALRRRMRPAPPVVLGEEIEVGGCAMTPARYSGQKVDLFAKGIKNQESLYFTHFDLEEY